MFLEQDVQTHFRSLSTVAGFIFGLYQLKLRHKMLCTGLFSSFVLCQVLKQCIFISRIQGVHGCVLFTAFPRSLVLFPLTSIHQMCLQKRGWWLAGDAEDTLAFVGPYGSITRSSGGTVKQCQT